MFKKAFALALLVFGVAANAVAAAYVEGAADGWYAGAVTGACMLGWILQFGVDRSASGTRIRCRVRVASHMVYWYGYVALEGVLFLVLGLVVAGRAQPVHSPDGSAKPRQGRTLR